ncbi:MAG: 16S rRNA (guanine(527)-N(7))-methyltransferase RsmG [Lautropia sp.]|nr:16S rRNA (guanine(527)-N(7))-methyltransferase RsmG [Lautropia sp.]
MNNRHPPPQRSDTQWTEDDTDCFRHGLQSLALELTPEAFEQVIRWARLLKQWNRTYNLLGNTDSTHLINEHLLDSLAVSPVIARYLDRHSPLVDVGTGAGFPGVLLAITQPQRPIFLLEPVGKKVAFLRHSVLTLRLNNAQVLPGKIEILRELLDKQVQNTSPRQLHAEFNDSVHSHKYTTPLINPPSDVHDGTLNFICRAFTSLGRFAALCEPYMSDDSLLFAMKSLRLTEEQQELPESIHLQTAETIRTIEPGVHRNLAILARNSTPPSVLATHGGPIFSADSPSQAIPAQSPRWRSQ